MSQFHAFYTLGCVITAVILSALLKSGLSVIYSVISLIVVGVILQTLSLPGFLETRNYSYEESGNKVQAQAQTSFYLSKKEILLCGLVCFVMYMCEGMVMDWGGVFLVQVHNVDVAIASILFIILETSIGLFRLCANFVANVIGQRKMLCSGIVIASISLITIAQSPNVTLILVCIAIFGIAIAAQVPMILSFCAKNSQNKTASLATISTLGYAGVLFGPALLGYIASTFSLPSIFRFMSLMVTLTFFVLLKVYKNKS